mgnify:CR=1 FL=1
MKEPKIAKSKDSKVINKRAQEKYEAKRSRSQTKDADKKENRAPD